MYLYGLFNNSQIRRVNKFEWLLVFKPKHFQRSWHCLDTVGATCRLPIKGTKTDGRWKETPGERPYVSVSLQQWSTCSHYCCNCSLTQCASADQRTISHPVSELLILSYRASRYFNGWRDFLGNALLWVGPHWPWHLAVASFKQEQKFDSRISTNHIMAFHSVWLFRPMGGHCINSLFLGDMRV